MTIWMKLLFALALTLPPLQTVHAGEAEPPREPTADAPEDPPDPPGLTHYAGREIAVTMHYLGAPWLMRESREREEECSLLIKNLKIKPGMTICDMGCGNGFYTTKLAEMTGPTGKVLAVDIQKEMLAMLRTRMKENDIKNVEPILGTLSNPKLPEGAVDVMFMVDVYHEFSHPVHMLNSIRKSLKPDGLIALVEFRLEDPKVPIKLVHKMSKEQILKEFPASGFKLADQFDGLPWQHLMFFKLDPNWKPAEEKKAEEKK